MLSINKVFVTGRLTRDPETKYLPSGQALTNLGLAVNRRFQDKSGEWRDDTMFIDVETWGKTAERCAETLRKGQPVFVEGRLKQDTWERDGQKQSKIRITADTVKGFDAGRGGQQSGSDEGGESEGEYGGGSGESSQPRSSAPASQGGQRAAAAPSDGLNFDNKPSNVDDNIPF